MEQVPLIAMDVHLIAKGAIGIVTYESLSSRYNCNKTMFKKNQDGFSSYTYFLAWPASVMSKNSIATRPSTELKANPTQIYISCKGRFLFIAANPW